MYRWNRNPSPPMRLPPGAELGSDFCISFAGKSSGRRVHQNFPFSGPLVTKPLTGEREGFELGIGQRRIDDQAPRRFCVDEKKIGHPSILP